MAHGAKGEVTVEERVVRIGEWKICDICKTRNGGPLRQAVYDARLNTGTWGYLCQQHFDEFGVGLGIGRGVKITK